MRLLMTMLAGSLLALSVNAQPRDPRIGEWREDRNATSVGLYLIFEDLGDGMIRYHLAANLAPQNRLFQNYRCDGNFYPVVDARGDATGRSTSCTIVDANTVAVRTLRNADEGEIRGEGTWTLSSDANHLTGAFEEKDRNGTVVQVIERAFTRNSEPCLSSEESVFRECQMRTTPPRN